MTPTVAKVVRVLTILVFIGVVALAVRAFNPEEPNSVTAPGKFEIDVAHAINGFEDRSVTVRGDVFVGPGGLGLRLCQGRQNTSPPTCLGPFLDLDGVNEGSFALEKGTTKAGPVRFTEESLALRGTVTGTRLAVSEVLR